MKTFKSLVMCTAFSVVALVLSSGCASYVTPGGAVNLQAIRDVDIKEQFNTKPAANFPAKVAVVRVQESGYFSNTARGYGHGRFSVVTTRDIEKEEHFEKLGAFPLVSGIGSVNKLLLSPDMQSLKDLRVACAGLHADMMLVYTLDTGFRIKSKALGPFEVIALGALPNKKAFVNTTASAVLYDVRTGHIYGLAEATHTTSHLASSWTKTQVIDNARLNNEEQAFSKLVDEFSKTWKGVVNEYATKPAPQVSQAGSVYHTVTP